MNDFLNVFDRILYKGFYSWLKEQHVGYAKGADHRKACYALLIENEGKGFLNALYLEMEDTYNDYERIYLVHEALNVLEQKLERTALLTREQFMEVELIVDQQYWHSHMPSYNYSPGDFSQGLLSSPTHYRSCISNDRNSEDRAYILELVKKELVSLFMKVQDRYSKYIKRNMLSLEGIYWKFFRERVPEEFGVVKGNIVGENVIKSYRDNRTGDGCFDKAGIGDDVLIVEDAGVSYKKKRFEPVMGDIRAVEKGVHSYDDIVANKGKFARLEEELFSNELLDTEYRFRRKPHGNVMKMAAVYWVAFQKGYFVKHYFRDRRKIPIAANDARLFLNHRYDTNIERQFQNLSKEKLLSDYLERDVMFRFIFT